MSTLKEEDEEFQMLLEVADGRSRQHERNKETKKSGDVTEQVIRNHLLRRGFNMSLVPNVKIGPLNTKNDMLLLKSDADPSNPVYNQKDVWAVLEVKNNAVVQRDKTGKYVSPSIVIREKFDRLKNIGKDLHFAVVVLSERDDYTYKITEEICRYPVFTLISRRIQAGKWMKSRDDILEMRDKTIERGKWAGKLIMERTGKWDELISFLQRIA